MTSAAEWRQAREEGYVKQLPSGRCVKLRPASIDIMMRNGMIPDVLSDMAAKVLWETASELEALLTNNPELRNQYLDLVNCIVPAVVVEPRVLGLGERSDLAEMGDGEQIQPLEAGTILLEDISFRDRDAIFQIALLPAESLRSFRIGQKGDVEAVPDGEDAESETE